MSGHWGDRFGGRRLLTLGAILSCGLNWVTSFGRSFWPLVIPWAANGFAQSMGFAPASRLIANWWGPRERGRAFGIFTFAAGFGSVLTFAAAILVLGRLSWTWIFRLPVLLMPAAALVFSLLVRDRPEELGFSAASDRRDGPAAPRAHGPRTSALRGYRDVVGNRPFLIASLGFGLSNWARLGLLVWVPAHFLGPTWMEDPTGAWITLALPIGMAVGALVAGYAADQLFHADHARLIFLSLVLATVAILALFFTPRDEGVLGIALLFLAGFFVFGPFASYTALAPELLGPDLVGTGTGFMNAVGYGTAALGDLVIGMVIDTTGRTDSIFLITAGACLVGASSTLAVRR